MDIDNLISSFENNYYNELLKYTDDNELIDVINNIINNLNKVNIVIQNTENNTVEESDMSVYYKKPWSKLNKIHKILKIKDFIENSILNKNKKNELIILLIDLIKNKTLTRKDMVEYDEDKCKIINIPNLKIISSTQYIYKD
jgi:hypothetical protein